MQLDWEPQAGESLPVWAQDRATTLQGAPLSQRIDRARWAARGALLVGALCVVGALCLLTMLWRRA